MGIHLARHNLFVDLDGLIGIEWRISSSHFVNQHPQGPPINGFIVALENKKKRKVDTSEQSKRTSLDNKQMNLKNAVDLTFAKIK